MRLRRRTALAAALVIGPALAASAASVGCGGDDSNVGPGPAPGSDGSADSTTDSSVPPTDASRDALGPDTSVSDAGADAPTTADAGDASVDSADAFDAGPQAFVRVAWLQVPNYPYATPDGGATATYDVCFAPHGTSSWQGPIVAAAGGSLSPQDVSAYFPVAPGQYDIRLVATPTGQTPTCAAVADDAGSVEDAGLVDDAGEDGGGGGAGGGSLTDFTNLPTLAVDQRMTAVVTPSFDGSNPLNWNLFPLLDDTQSAAGQVAVRFVNATDPQDFNPLSYGLGGGGVFTPWFTGVTASEHVLGAGDEDGGVDTNGYVQIAPFSQIDTTVKNGPHNFGEDGLDYGISGALALTAGQVITAFSPMGFLSDGNGIAGGLIVCFDGQVGSEPYLSKCTPFNAVDISNAPPAAQTRFGNFLADTTLPGLDTCLKYHAQSAYGMPLGGELLDAGFGSPAIDFGQFSFRYAIHAGFTYDLRVVAAGGDCSTGLAPDQTYTPAAAPAAESVVYTGYVDPDAGFSDVGFQVLSFPEVGCGEGAPVVRVVNLDAVDGVPVTVSFSGKSSWSIADVPYGADTSSTTLDACGYLGVAAGNGNFTATFGSPAGYTIGALDQLTFFVSSQAPNSSGVTVCHEFDPQDPGTFASCASFGF